MLQFPCKHFCCVAKFLSHLRIIYHANEIFAKKVEHAKCYHPLGCWKQKYTLSYMGKNVYYMSHIQELTKNGMKKSYTKHRHHVSCALLLQTECAITCNTSGLNIFHSTLHTTIILFKINLYAVILAWYNAVEHHLPTFAAERSSKRKEHTVKLKETTYYISILSHYPICYRH